MPVTWTPISVGGTRLEPGTLALIAGPCSLEDPGMAEEVAREVKRIAAELKLPFVFKASYAKANRSAGESYRGPGAAQGRSRRRRGSKRSSIARSTQAIGRRSRCSGPSGTGGRGPGAAS